MQHSQISPTLSSRRVSSPYSNKLFVDTNQSSLQTSYSINQSDNNTLLLMSTYSNDNSKVITNDSGITSSEFNSPVISFLNETSNLVIKKQIKKPNLNLFNLKFNTCVSNMFGITIEITESILFANKNKMIGNDEHFEYLIDVKLNTNNISEPFEHWCIFRRYSRIRQLHEQMTQVYPSLNCLVFPSRLIFNQSEKALIERQYQLEHYLKCFIEILLNDSSSSIYFLSNTMSDLGRSLTSDSLNSIYSSSYATTSASSLYTNNLNVLTRAKLCAFCSFFEPNEFDKSYFENKKDGI